MLRGNPRQHALPKHEPKPLVACPPPPRHLTKIGRAFWVRHARMLAETRVMTEHDMGALELASETYEEWRAARKVVVAQGQTCERVTENGSVIVTRRPEIDIAADASRRLLRFLVEFGLTPSSRTKVRMVDAGDGKDPLQEFLSRGAATKGA